MKIKKIENITVYYNDFRIEENQELNDFLSCEKFRIFLKKLDKNIVVILGGDGTFLEVVKKIYKKNKSFLGINFGKKGFLLNDKNIIDFDIELVKMPYNLLECSINNEKTVCFNEFDIKISDSKMLDLDIIVDNEYKLNLVGDGLIVSTPAGSTGYNASLSGPIINHNSRSFIVTPKAPWKPRNQSSIILDDKSILSLKTTGRQFPFEIYSDGKLFKNIESDSNTIINIKKSNYKIKLYTTKKCLNKWKSKIFEEQGFEKIYLQK